MKGIPDRYFTVKRPPDAAVTGTLLALFGLAVVAAWALRWQAVLDFFPGYRTVAATGLAFAIAGGALMAEALAEPRRSRLQLGAALALVAIGIVTCVEHALDRNLGLDLPSLHDWGPATSLRPGRMAVPTAVGILCAGEAILALRARSPRPARWLIAVVGVIGIAVLVGNALNVGVFFPSYALTQVAYATGVAFIVLAIGLWQAFIRRAAYRPLWADDAARIGGLAAVFVLSASAIAALAGFALMQRTAEQSLRNELAAQLAARIALVENELAHHRLAAQALAMRPDLQRTLRQAPRNPGAAAELQRHLAAQLQFGFIALAALGPAGEELAETGAPAREPFLRRPLDPVSSLAWTSGFELESRVEVSDRGERLGTLVLSQPLSELSPPSTAGELLVLCFDDAGALRCFPGAGPPAGVRSSLEQARPQMRLALAGRSGVLRGPDHSGTDVIVAYAPIGSLGLGSALRLETAALFGRLRGQFLWLALLLAALAAGTLVVLRLELAPLVRRLARSEERLRRALEGSRLALWEYDTGTRRIQMSAEWSTMRGGPEHETSSSVEELYAAVPEEEVPLITRHVRQVLTGALPHYDIEHRVRRLDRDEWMWIRSRGEVVERDRKGRALRVLGTNADITARKERELATLREATQDPLTGLANRRLFRDRLEHAIARARRSGDPLSVIYIDLDRLKAVNDAFGHAVGDELIRAFAARLSACLRAGDTAARLGGDEFAVILEGLASRDHAALVAEKIVAAMRAPFPIGERSLQASASLGVAILKPQDAFRPEALLARADAALYDAKHAGRDRYAVAA